MIGRLHSTVATYAYDYQSRRITKTVGSTVTNFVYDGWNPIAEYTSTLSPLSFTLSTSYTWGMDLSGSMQGAGGVGGLLSLNDGSATYYPTFDGNGNVSEYVDATGVVVAHYEYDAFGQVVASGSKKDDFTHQFSTKQLDSESGLHYYGYRYYDSSNGRWPGRDPIEERGGTNLYGFIGNDGVNTWDYLGLIVSGKFIQNLARRGNDGYLFGYEFKGNANQLIIQTVKGSHSLECGGVKFYEQISEYSEAFILSGNGLAYDKHGKFFPKFLTGVMGSAFANRPQKCKTANSKVTYRFEHKFQIYEKTSIVGTLPIISNFGQTFRFSKIGSFNNNGPSTTVWEIGKKKKTYGQDSSGFRGNSVKATGGNTTISITHKSSSTYDCSGKLQQYNNDAKSPNYK